MLHMFPQQTKQNKTKLIIPNLYKGPSWVDYDRQEYDTQVYYVETTSGNGILIFARGLHGALLCNHHNQSF